MPRPRKCRRIGHHPSFTTFKPRGVPMRDLTEVYLSLEGMEAIRLVDAQGMSQEEGARSMGISRHTFGRILGEARGVVARALVQGMALCVSTSESEAVTWTEEAMERLRLEGLPELEFREKEDKGEAMKKIAITAQGPKPEDMMDSRFGRAAGFVILNLEDEAVTYVDNGSSQARAHGAGLNAAEILNRQGVDMLITGFVGPKAQAALLSAGIKTRTGVENMTVGEAIEKAREWARS